MAVGTRSRLGTLLVESMGQAVAISAGAQHSLLLANDGTVWAWGDGRYGQLGIGLFNVGSTAPVPINPFPGGRRAIGISAGGYHCLALAQDVPRMESKIPPNVR